MSEKRLTEILISYAKLGRSKALYIARVILAELEEKKK